MRQKLFIPKKLKIGFQNRSDTFTGKLAYVIYYDEKGVLRKETSWKGWCDASIPAIELDNTAVNGFVLNKGVQRYADWGSGRSVIRVHHPEGFEFEISVDNLIGILMHADVAKRDIQEACVFAWAGTELVLLPVNSEAYQESVAFTAKQDQKVSAKSLVKGRQYSLKKSDAVLTYIGYFDWYSVDWSVERQPDTSFSLRSYGQRWSTSYYTQNNKGKKHVFFDGKTFAPFAPAALAAELAADVAINYAELVDQFFHSASSQPITDLVLKPLPTTALEVNSYRGLPLHRMQKVTPTTLRVERINLSCGHYGRVSLATIPPLTGYSYNVTTAPTYVCASGPAASLTIPVGPPSLLTPDDLAPGQGEGCARTMALSANLLKHLSAEGWGTLHYVLANGNVAEPFNS